MVGLEIEGRHRLNCLQSITAHGVSVYDSNGAPSLRSAEDSGADAAGDS